ncbi:MAG: sensor histidine kinase [Bacteroidota bacterium]
MGTSVILLSSLVYLLFLFGIAFFAHKKAKEGRSIVNNPYTYALSLAVYCTAWTFYGSVGKAASSGGFSFLTIYVGPILVAPLWIFLLKKIILISKSQRITSIADFISARYGKSTNLGVLVTLVAVVGVIPYIALQLKAIDLSSNILSQQQDALDIFLDGSNFFRDKAFLIAVVLTIFTILFGARHLDPNERHEGLVAAIAFESIWKLVAFLAIGVFVTFGIYNGFEDVFSQAYAQPTIANIFSLKDSGVDSWSWTWMVILSMSAFMFLPRQFHVLVVENTDIKFIEKAAWLLPLYLLLINIFVLPIACGGLLHFPNGSVEPDNFVLGLPLNYGYEGLALFVYLGGLSAATGMVIVAITALSIMISNNLVMPFWIKSSFFGDTSGGDLSKPLINIRRASIVIVMLMAYTYFKWVGASFSLVSIGLISFAAIAQFFPIVIGGLYWKRATEKGAFCGLLVGFLMWGITLSFPTLAEVGMISRDFIENGYLGIGVLKPYQLFGMEGNDLIAHSAFWSLVFNIITYITVSMNTMPSPIEITQADLFVDIEKYTNQTNEFEVLKKEAKYDDIKKLMVRFLGKKNAKRILKDFAKVKHLDLKKIKSVDADFINFAETHLAGSIGAASAKVVLESVVKEDPISLEEMLNILDQTQEIIQYSKALEKKSRELEATTYQLKAANEQLKELDQLKADFITTVTHELRTPITSIKSLAKIMHDNRGLTDDKRADFLEIMVNESERIARLINQVLDLEKVQSKHIQPEKKQLDINELVQKVCQGFEVILANKAIKFKTHFPQDDILLTGNYDRLTQVVVNLISNAIKFCDEKNGIIEVSLDRDGYGAIKLKVKDNGIGIAPSDQQLIFKKFTQVSHQKSGKPKGSGLGLSICKEIVEQHQGMISVESALNEGTTFIVQLPIREKLNIENVSVQKN